MKAPWYIRSHDKGARISFHPLWIKWQKLKIWLKIRLSK